jgi:hypothetical protein
MMWHKAAPVVLFAFNAANRLTDDRSCLPNIIFSGISSAACFADNIAVKGLHNFFSLVIIIKAV